MKNDNLKNQYRVNEQIRANEVRIVGDDIESVVMPLHKALALAEEKELDLVEISPTANPPVCRLIEYSKFLYQMKKRQKEQKAKQVKIDVKEIRFVDGAAGVLVKKVKCDFKKLGPKFGKQMKAVANAVATLSQEEIASLEKNGSLALNLDGAEAVIEAADVEIFSEDIPGWLVANEGKLTIALDVTVTEELRREGVARELVNRIQNIRKSSGFEITDKISITLSKNILTDDAVNEYKEYICNQVLATSLTLADEVNGTELEFDDFKLYALVSKC